MVPPSPPLPQPPLAGWESTWRLVIAFLARGDLHDITSPARGWSRLGVGWGHLHCPIAPHPSSAGEGGRELGGFKACSITPNYHTPTFAPSGGLKASLQQAFKPCLPPLKSTLCLYTLPLGTLPAPMHAGKVCTLAFVTQALKHGAQGCNPL